jgi:exosortase/archaeosortase family protein
MGSAIAIAFTVNAVRVAIVAALFDRPDKGAFQYWHEGIGAHLFSILPVMLFYGVFYIFLEQSSAGEAMGEKHST